MLPCQTHHVKFVPQLFVPGFSQDFIFEGITNSRDDLPSSISHAPKQMKQYSAGLSGLLPGLVANCMSGDCRSKQDAVQVMHGDERNVVTVRHGDQPHVHQRAGSKGQNGLIQRYARQTNHAQARAKGQGERLDCGGKAQVGGPKQSFGADCLKAAIERGAKGVLVVSTSKLDVVLGNPVR
jgi:hypothetical protein